MAKNNQTSKSYEASGVEFDPTNDPTKNFDPSDTDVQSAIERAKANSASTTEEGLVERATDAEAAAGTDTTRYVSPKHLKDNIPQVVYDADFDQIPVTIYGGYGSQGVMITTYDSGSPQLPLGSIIVYEQRYTYVVGWGNGSATVVGYRRRSIAKCEDGVWRHTNQA